MGRGGSVARPSPRCCPGKAVARGAMAGGGSIRAAALPGTLLPRTPPAGGERDGGTRISPRCYGSPRAASRVRAGGPSCAIQDVLPFPTRWATGRRSQG